MDNPEGAIDYSVGGGVARLTLDRPQKRNALTTSMYRGLATRLRQIGEDSTVRVVVLAGAAGAFTAGNDLQDLRHNGPTGDGDPPVEFLDALVALPQVLVAAVDGPAIGVGTTMLLHADFVYATVRSVFAMPFVSLGLIPEAASTYLLPSLVGHIAAAELLLLGRSFNAREAVALGLVTAVVDDDVALATRIGEVTTTLEAMPGRALLETRRLLRLHRRAATAERMALDGAILRELLTAGNG